MTIRMYVACDGKRCFQEFHIDDIHLASHEINIAGWQENQEENTHYCPDCWEIVKGVLEKGQSR